MGSYKIKNVKRCKITCHQGFNERGISPIPLLPLLYLLSQAEGKLLDKTLPDIIKEINQREKFRQQDTKTRINFRI